MQDPALLLVAAMAALIIGLSKGGFGGGLGMLTTPLCVLAFGAKSAIGILLPLLCAGDVFSLYHYWGRWNRRNLFFLFPGVIVGVVIGVQLIDRFSARQLNITIGSLAVGFVIFQWIKEWLFRAEGTFVPTHAIGFPFGLGAGITSTFAHGAGPVVSLFLIPQRMAKEFYVGTTVLIFTWINLIKLPFFIASGIINWETLRSSLVFLPLVPVGVWLGVWLNRKVSEALFLRLTYIFTMLTGLQLIFAFDLSYWFR